MIKWYLIIWLIFLEEGDYHNSGTSQMIVDSVRDEIKEMIAMVVKDGGVPGGDEYFYAAHMFTKK